MMALTTIYLVIAGVTAWYAMYTDPVTRDYDEDPLTIREAILVGLMWPGFVVVGLRALVSGSRK
jgi:hypothetical protein